MLSNGAARHGAVRRMMSVGAARGGLGALWPVCICELLLATRPDYFLVASSVVGRVRASGCARAASCMRLWACAIVGTLVAAHRAVCPRLVR